MNEVSQRIQDAEYHLSAAVTALEDALRAERATIGTIGPLLDDTQRRSLLATRAIEIAEERTRSALAALL